MSLLITGNMGYVGPGVVRHMRSVRPGTALAGYDAGYFAPCLLDPVELPERLLDEQHFGDVREVAADVLRGVESVVHLAGVSNDPIGKAYEQVTDDINARATVALAAKAKAAGARSFVFASSCSVYGCAESGARNEQSETNPLTAYAKSKVTAEEGLRGLASADFRITALRFATACGYSPRLRLDLVLNDFVASAIRDGALKILSDGTPWRPLIHVNDMARAIDWAVDRTNGPAFLAVNAGSDIWNYQVKDLAQAVAARIHGTEVFQNRDAQPDKRSYRVDFTLFRQMAPEHQPQVTLEAAIDHLVTKLTNVDFRHMPDVERFSRLKFLGRLAEQGKLSPELSWTNSTELQPA